MTSTGRGELTGRSSSRVLRPPGGGTSNIFGIADEPKPAAAATTTTTASTDNDVNVESSQPETESLGDVDAAAAEAADEGVDIDDEEQKVEDEEEQRIVAAAAAVETNADTVSDTKPVVKPVDAADIKKNQAIGFNPITGQSYNNNNNAQIQDSTKAQIRIRQPPGGASTKLW